MRDPIQCIKCHATSYNDPGKTPIRCHRCYTDVEDERDRLLEVLQLVKFELDHNLGMDSKSIDENELLEHRVLAFDAAHTVCLREKMLEIISEVIQSGESK